MKKLTHEQYTEKLCKSNKHYRNGDFEIVSKYINSRTKILVRNKYGECLVSPKNLLKGNFIGIQISTNKNNYCINQFKEVHKDTYDYGLVKYVNNKTKVKIICKEHGLFEQAPAFHLLGQGCYECVRYSRLDGYRLTTKKFVKKANKVHKNKYLYTKANVKGNKNKVIITCKKHGDFEQSPNSHLRGNGCKLCSTENKGHGKSSFLYFAKNSICRLYLIEVWNGEEQFLKIGITSKTVDVRFSGNREMPYKYNILAQIKSKNAGEIWEQEIKLKQKFKVYKYRPKLNFKGHTECFKLSQKENIINYLKSL